MLILHYLKFIVIIMNFKVITINIIIIKYYLLIYYFQIIANNYLWKH